ncbi:SERTA domain-containing protein 4 [Electrophorus electricus]|uniref:SERTA domain-containing protein 4 n=1 Tax=Electrophorus electricus TaxID=8005 RepID=UPI0015CFA5FD|nr:SERTA domain-containing protein 4 [Electrophorus electricus]
MTLVLSMNPFCDHEPEAPPPLYQPIWESEHCSKSCVSTPTPSGGDAQELTDGSEPPCRRAPDHVTMSRIAYFKRKYVEDDDLPLSFRSYCHTVPPVLEEHAHILRLSLEKMRFIDDPEAFLRRSVLINNLLRRLRTEILLQRDWRFPPAPAAMPCAVSMTAPAPVSTHGHTHPHASPASRPCFALPSPHRKRLRLVRGEATDRMPTCCCLFAAGRYLQLPLCVYEGAAHCVAQPSSSSSLPGSSSAERFEPLLDEEEDEDEDEEEEEEEESDGEEGLGALCPGLDLCEAAVRAGSRERTRTRARTRELGHQGGGARGREKEREKPKGRGGETIAAGSSRWMPDGMETGHQGALVWAQVGRK